MEESIEISEVQTTTKSNSIEESKPSECDTNKQGAPNIENGILEFMDVDEMIDYYDKINSNNGRLNLEWTFYKKRKPNGESAEESELPSNENATNEIVNKSSNTLDSEFDFTFDDLQSVTNVNDTLSLSKRDIGNDKKTNLNDIMSEIRKNQPTT